MKKDNVAYAIIVVVATCYLMFLWDMRKREIKFQETISDEIRLISAKVPTIE